MARGAWDPTANLLAMLINVNSDGESPLCEPIDMHPFRVSQKSAKQETIIPYDPKVLEAIMEGRKAIV
jgi:hypothetical protein